MEKPLKEKVFEALREAAGPDACIELDEVPPNKIGGLVLSGSFATQSPTERQDKIWKSLAQRLDASERARVVFIVTDTPEEYEVIKRATG